MSERDGYEGIDYADMMEEIAAEREACTGEVSQSDRMRAEAEATRAVYAEEEALRDGDGEDAAVLFVSGFRSLGPITGSGEDWAD